MVLVSTTTARPPASSAVLVGRYHLGESIGRGGMAEVFAATELDRRRSVAVKLPHLDTRPDEACWAFEQEATRAARIRHPNVVSVLDWGVDDVTGQPFIVMNHLRGRDLRSVLRAGPLPVPASLRITAEVARALAACHSCGIAHRDIKPDNIIFDRSGRVTLVDFGICREIGAEDERPEFEGTLAYMSPQQAASRPPDPRDDLFGLGCVLRELLTGRPPFESWQTLLRLSGHPVRPTPLRVPGVSPRSRLHLGLERLDAALLAPAADARPATADDVADGLVALLAMSPTSAGACEATGPGADEVNEAACAPTVRRPRRSTEPSARAACAA